MSPSINNINGAPIIQQAPSVVEAPPRVAKTPTIKLTKRDTGMHNQRNIARITLPVLISIPKTNKITIS